MSESSNNPDDHFYFSDSDIDLSRYDIWADTGEIESYVFDVLADPGDRDYSDIYDGDSSYSGHLDGMDELDFIFAE